MSIARRVAPLACSLVVLGLVGAAAADQAPAAESPKTAVGSVPDAAASAESAPVPAEPVPPPPIPAKPPVMPVTVVRPSSPAPQAVPPVRHGVVELGRAPRTASRWRGFPISLSLRDAPLPEVLRSFARIAGVNLVLAPGVTGSVTVELHDVPWDQALSVILLTHGMDAEIDGRVWSVEPR